MLLFNHEYLVKNEKNLGRVYVQLRLIYKIHIGKSDLDISLDPQAIIATYFRLLIYYLEFSTGILR